MQLNKEFQAEEAPTVILCISMQWFREWESFVKGKDNGKARQHPKQSLPLHILQPSIHLYTLFGCDLIVFVLFLRASWAD